MGESCVTNLEIPLTIIDNGEPEVYKGIVVRVLLITFFVIVGLIVGLFVFLSFVFKDKRPEIYFAAETGDTNYIASYLGRGSNVNSLIVSYRSGHRYSSLIHIAAYGGHTNAVDFLLKKGANPNQLDSSGNPPIDHAIARGSDETHIQIVRMLIDAGADPNLRYESEYQYTPLLAAASLGQTNMVRLLLAKGADVDSTNKIGQTALHLVWRAAGVAKILLEAGANPNTLDAYGETPINYAVRNNDSNTLAVLTNFPIQSQSLQP